MQLKRFAIVSLGFALLPLAVAQAAPVGEAALPKPCIALFDDQLAEPIIKDIEALAPASNMIFHMFSGKDAFRRCVASGSKHIAILTHSAQFADTALLFSNLKGVVAPLSSRDLMEQLDADTKLSEVRVITCHPELIQASYAKFLSALAARSEVVSFPPAADKDLTPRIWAAISVLAWLGNSI